MKIKVEDARPAERSVLAVALTYPDAAREVLLQLAEQDFILPEHKAVYHGMKALEETGGQVDIAALDNVLKGDGAYANAGGFDFLVDLTSDSLSATLLESSIAIVQKNGREKRVFDGLRLIAVSDEEAIPQMEALIERERAAMKSARKGNILAEQIEAFILRLEKPDPMARIRTGLPTLDKHTGGLPMRSSSLVGARPGVGKTDIMCNWTCRALWDRHKVQDFSLEMPTEQILERYAAELARVNYSLINQNRVRSQDDRALIGEKLVDTLLSGDRLEVIDDVNSIDGIIREIARFRPDIAFIDYMQIIEPAQRYRDSRRREIDEIGRAIKKAAKRYDCHICVLSQVNRDSAEREPKKEDLSESDTQGQQFDIVMLLDRPAFYVKSRDVGADKARLIMDKNKYGSTARLDLYYEGAYQTFTEAAKNVTSNKAREPGEN